MNKESAQTAINRAIDSNMVQIARNKAVRDKHRSIAYLPKIIENKTAGHFKDLGLIKVGQSKDDEVEEKSISAVNRSIIGKMMGIQRK